MGMTFKSICAQSVKDIDAENELYLEIESAILSDVEDGTLPELSMSDILRISHIASRRLYSSVLKALEHSVNISKPGMVKAEDERDRIILTFRDLYISLMSSNKIKDGESKEVADIMAENAWRTVCIVNGIKEPNDKTKRVPIKTD